MDYHLSMQIARNIQYAKQLETQKKNLCKAIARLAKHLCIEECDPYHLTEILASRLITLDKCPEIRQ